MPESSRTNGAAFRVLGVDPAAAGATGYGVIDCGPVGEQHVTNGCIKAGTGDFPKGLLSHAAGLSDDGSFVVSEVWSSRQANEDFMQARLGEALASSGVPAPSKVTWVSLIAYQTPNA